jgi:hypothetical protein
MVLLAKLALGFTGTVVLAGAYTFHDGVLQIEADEHRAGGQHVHVWAPAAIVPMALHVVSDRDLEKAVSQVAPWLPTIRALTKELKKYPDVEFVDVYNDGDHFQLRIHKSKLVVNVDTHDQQVHVACPLAMIDDVTSEFAARTPGI